MPWGGEEASLQDRNEKSCEKFVLLFKKKVGSGPVRGGGEDGADREEGAHMHHADPATLAVA